MATVAGALIVLFLVVVLASPFVAIAWVIWDARTNPRWHDLYCICLKCAERQLKEEITKREWRRRAREREYAVDEMERAVRGGPS